MLHPPGAQRALDKAKEGLPDVGASQALEGEQHRCAAAPVASTPLGPRGNGIGRRRRPPRLALAASYLQPLVSGSVELLLVTLAAALVWVCPQDQPAEACLHLGIRRFAGEWSEVHAVSCSHGPQHQDEGLLGSTDR